MFIMSIAIGIIMGIIIGGLIIFFVFSKYIKERNHQIKKIRIHNDILSQWIKIKDRHESCVDYFLQNGYKVVGIYGMGVLGQRLFDELKDTDCLVKCVIDKRIDHINTNVGEIITLHPDDDIPEIDVIVVTASYYFYEIKEQLMRKTKCDIVPIEDVIYFDKI